MYVAQLTFILPASIDRETMDNMIYDLLPALRNGGQINESDYQIAFHAGYCSATVLLPAREALESVHDSARVTRVRAQFRDAGIQGPVVTLLGEEIESLSPCACAAPSTYILFTHFLTRESPLRCGACFHPVPLYAIPPTDGEDFRDVLSWQADYTACDTLQMDSETLERAALREMGEVKSSLSRHGRAICATITVSTGIPTYYYLHRWNARSRARELKRLCPDCGGAWLRAEPWHIFDFQCDRCRLLSNIAFAVR